MSLRIFISGPPLCGKSTFSEQFKHDCKHTDDFLHLEWSTQSDEVAKCIDDPSITLMEGTAVVRGLRKWLDDNDGKPCDVLIWMSNPKAAWTRNHQRMASSMNTIMDGIYEDLVQRGVDIIGFGSNEEEDEIHIF